MYQLSSGSMIAFRKIVFISALLLVASVNLRAQKSPHGPLKQPCTDCHTTESWKSLAVPMKFNHSTTGFTLNGAHANTQCIQCHTTKRFTSTSTECFSCHAEDFTKTLDPNHLLGRFSHDCLTCHTMNGWRPSIFLHSKTNFQLTGAHRSVQCSSCHTNNRFAGLQNDCYSCHFKDFQSTKTPNHATGKFSHECLTCHTMNAWQPSTFDHNKTDFRLTGAHQTVECSSCHGNGIFNGLHQDCYSCHVAQFTSVGSPNHVTGQFSHDCLSCHTNMAWKPATFDHNKTSFPLVQAHASVECASCHKNGQFTALSTDCYSCHQKDFAAVVTPNHVAGQLSHDCVTCHTMVAWKPSTFDHNKTNFTLVGAHTTAECASCHASGQFKGLPTDCYSCHQKDFAAVVTPNHVTGQLSHDCTTCHGTTVWKPSTFDHNKTNFSLVGAHITAECASCHASGQFKGLPSDCYSCHQKDFADVVTPNHVTGQLSHDCSTCHGTMVWKPSTFDHNKTNFSLVGAHITAECASCHASGQFKGLPTDCYSCHQKDFADVVTPNHVTGQLSHDCTTCHGTTVWKPSTFNHSTTNFALAGAHAALDCASCHSTGVFNGLPSDCYSCHQNDFAGTATPAHPSTPNHVTGQLSHDCTTCHTTTVWYPSTFSHNATNFQLVGAHISLDCASCHSSGVFKGLPSDCYSCHQKDFAGTATPAHPSTPNHVTGQLSHDCTTCHTTNVWYPSTFNHANTNFQLTGAHSAVACNSCHINGQYAGLPTVCYSCHQADFTGVTNPNHVSGNFDHNCLTCHTTDGWSPAKFDHNTTSFPLTGAHANVPVCTSCHINGQFTGTPTDCYSCHKTNYDNTTNPNHAAAKFPTTCLTCHTTTTWSGATFNHTWFPTNHGKANGVCSECHTNSSDYKVFQCTDCHTKSKTDSDHKDEPGYVYNSTNCYSCHPKGKK